VVACVKDLSVKFLVFFDMFLVLFAMSIVQGSRPGLFNPEFQ